jgi:hypothetical protein
MGEDYPYIRLMRPGGDGQERLQHLQGFLVLINRQRISRINPKKKHMRFVNLKLSFSVPWDLMKQSFVTAYPV